MRVRASVFVGIVAALLLSVPGWAARARKAVDPPEIYINGVRVERVVDTTLRGVNVRFDEDGNIWIDAPGYVIQGMQSTAEQPTGPGKGPVPAGRWWLVIDDRDSYGHTVDVLVNGQRVATIRSGQSNPVVDLAPYLQWGLNTVRFEARPGPPPSGGDLRIYVGTGRVERGTLKFDKARIEYVRDVTSPPGEAREFNLTVE